jgi:hypothetical protein
MASRAFTVVLGTVVVLAFGGAIIAVRLDNAHVRRQLDRLNGQRQRAERMRVDNRQLQEIITRVQADTADGARAIHDDLVRARAEVEELERKARVNHTQMRTQAAQDAENLANNRDPEKGLMRLEHFRNKGRATPVAAFETFVWAAMNGEDATLADMIAMDSVAREKDMAVIATFSEETRAKYPTPEKLAALFFAGTLTAQPAAQVSNVSFSDAQHATVQVRGLTDRTQKIPMEFGSQGWQIVVPVGMAEKLRAWALGGTPSPAGK